MQVNQYSIRFIEKGLAGVSMSMIADKIGIKKPSLYKHFHPRMKLWKQCISSSENSPRKMLT